MLPAEENQTEIFSLCSILVTASVFICLTLQKKLESKEQETTRNIKLAKGTFWKATKTSKQPVFLRQNSSDILLENLKENCDYDENLPNAEPKSQ